MLTNLYGVIGWDNPILISSDRYLNKYPDVYQTDNKIFVAWVSYINNAPVLYFTYKDLKWRTPELVTKLKKNKIIHPSISFKDNQVFIVINNDENNIQLFYKNINSNEEFKELTLLTNNKINIMPKIYNYKNNLILFYQKYIDDKKMGIDYLKSIDITDFSSASENFITSAKNNFGSFFPLIKFHNDLIYALWTERLGEENTRNDVIYLKYSTDNFKTWSQNIILTDKDKDGRFPDFLIITNRLYLIYYTSEFENDKYNSYLITKIFDLNGFNLIEENKINIEFSDLYNLKLNFFNNKFYIFWYAYINKQSQIFNIESDDFHQWSAPAQITANGNNILRCILSQDNPALIIEKEINKKSALYFQEKDVRCMPPYLYSTTHKSNQWSYQNSVIFKWKEPYDISGIKGYAYLLDNHPETIPEIENLTANFNGKSFEGLEDGIYYLHIRAIDKADNFSPPVHYKIMINTAVPDPPRIFSTTHKEFIPNASSSPEISWIMKDNRPIKGFSYLLTRDGELFPDNKINIKKTNIKFQNIKEGIWYFKIKVCDMLNHWSDYSTYTLSIEKMILAVPTEKITEESESQYSYIIKPGDILSDIIMRILKIKKINEWRDYEKAIGKFNNIQNLDFLKPGDILMFPILIAKPSDTIETISRDIYGTENKKDKIVILGDTDFLSAGDKIIIKDKYFLKTGNIPAK